MNKTIVISASIKFHQLIKKTISNLKELGYTPLFPNLEEEPLGIEERLSPEQKMQLALEHYAAIDSADAVYFIVPEGYIGTSCTLELGYAFAKGKAIFFSEPTNDDALDGYVQKFIGLDELDTFASVALS